jgi:hypothetical protein
VFVDPAHKVASVVDGHAASAGDLFVVRASTARTSSSALALGQAPRVS